MNPLNLIQPQYKAIAIGLAILAAVIGLLWTGHHYGAQGVQAEWDREKLQAEQQAEQNRMLRQGAINKIDNAGAVRAKKQAATDQSIIAKVDKNVPDTLPMLPGSFRVQHDAAAAGKEIDDSGAVAAAPVAPRAVARTVTANYADARSDKANLTELQAIVRASGCFEVEE
jgi:hypothetical protein